MDWKRHRLFIMGGVAIALIGLTWWAVTQNTGDTQVAEEERPSLPDIDRDAVTDIEIHIPANAEREEEALTVRLHKDGETWRLTAPVEAIASSTAVSTALDKLADLDVVGRAATQARHHERLEVDEAHGIHVIARGGDETLIDMWVGAYQTGNTMVRVEGSDDVLMVQGSIKFAFNKRTADWRDRAVLELTAADVHEIEFQNENGHWLFRKEAPPAPEPAEGEEPAAPGAPVWTQIALEPAEGEEPAAPIENFEASKVETIVSSLARLRASGFGEASDTAASTGCEGSSRVRMVVGTGDDEQTVVLLVGNEQADGGNRYVMHEGDETIYVVSRFMAERLHPNVESFQPGDSGTEEPPPEMPPGMPGMGGGPGGPGGQIPPEIMQQIQQQLQAQGAHGGGGHP
ncbi:MAG: DUF4340 domain-containing protein [Sandaracinaceae bacterium]